MNKIYKYSLLFFVCIGSVFTYYQLFAEVSSTNQGYDLYKDRNLSICKPYALDGESQSENSTSKDEKLIFKTEEYPELGKDVDKNITLKGGDLIDAKSIYKENMNNIYKCAILGAQERSINKVLDGLKQSKKASAFSQELVKKKGLLTKSRKVNKCKNTNTSSRVQDKKSVLMQTTLELCKYNNYLEYLYEYNSVIANVIAQDAQLSSLKGTYDISTLAKKEKEKKAQIRAEIERAYKLHPIAFQTYVEYETNFPIHEMLTLIRKDFIGFRSALDQALTPINQVGYKIVNAMKK
ncbi:MAG: hypothetical protein GY828_02950 [Candidatus Gracilibacteria bacterium]|nr:hypothetical protein [Candidatus Gracilibacteria bacterium]